MLGHPVHALLGIPCDQRYRQRLALVVDHATVQYSTVLCSTVSGMLQPLLIIVLQSLLIIIPALDHGAATSPDHSAPTSPGHSTVVSAL